MNTYRLRYEHRDQKAELVVFRDVVDDATATWLRHTTASSFVVASLVWAAKEVARKDGEAWVTIWEEE